MVTRLAVASCALVIIGVSFVAGCSTSYPRPSSHARITKQQAIAIAHAELARRRLSKPAGAYVEVEDSVVHHEFGPFGPSRPEYIVRFHVGRSPRSAIYSMSVDPASGRVSSFVDIRDSIPVR